MFYFSLYVLNRNICTKLSLYTSKSQLQLGNEKKIKNFQGSLCRKLRETYITL